MKKQLSQGENKERDIIGTYSRLTETISKNPERFGVSKPIKPKVFGENYNLQWSGSFFESIKVNGEEIIADSPFLDGRDESKIIGLNKENQKIMEQKLSENAYENIIKAIS